MRGRAGVVVLVVSLFVAGVSAGAIRAGQEPPTTTGDTTTVSTTVETTTAATTTTTTAATTTTAKTTPRLPPATVLTAAPAGSGCLVLAAFALVEPGRATRIIGGAATLGARTIPEQDVAYPADGSIIRASSIDARAPGCTNGSAKVESLSLFGGAIRARSVGLSVSGARAAVEGLAVRKSVAGWGSVTTSAEPDPAQSAALAVHLNRARAGLPAGSVLLVSFAERALPKQASPAKAHAARTHTAKPRPAVHRQRVTHARRSARAKKAHRGRAPKHHLGDDPLTMTPPLGVKHYVFPVAGESSYDDSYGAFRGDVPGSWHHGDDLFAAIGTPVVAVADGTLNRVGWEHLGGWRLWVRDRNRNEFYYAHLSGYSPLALHSRHVHAGDVIGFIGNTGDAFTTPTHLHFEIHPHQLLRLDYNGAVDPTHYLDTWQHVKGSHIPLPEHPPFPRGAVRAEASYVWRRLLAARGLTAHAPKASERPRIRVPHADVAREPRRVVAAAGPRLEHASSGAPLVDVLAGLIVPSAAFGLTLALRLRRTPSS